MKDTAELLTKLKRLDLSTRKPVENILSGSYHSVFKGKGIEFSEVREYAAGDDVRSIDWNITARMGRPFIKEFIEERNLTLYVLFDTSASTTYGSIKAKQQVALEVSASLFFSAVKNQDKSGLLLFSSDVERFISARPGKKHAMSLLSEILRHTSKDNELGNNSTKGNQSEKPFWTSVKELFSKENVSDTAEMKGQTDLSKVLRKAGRMIKKRSIIAIVSDFISPDYEKELLHLSRKHDVIALVMRDQNEEKIPDVGYIEIEDAETGEQMLVNTSDPSFRKEYSMLASKEDQRLTQLFRKCRVDGVRVHSHEDFFLILKRLFDLRKRRLSL